MENPIWVTIITNIASAIISGLFGYFIKTYVVKKKSKTIMKQDAGNNSNQIQIGNINDKEQ